MCWHSHSTTCTVHYHLRRLPATPLPARLARGRPSAVPILLLPSCRPSSTEATHLQHVVADGKHACSVVTPLACAAGALGFATHTGLGGAPMNCVHETCEDH
jgi:hypothetical protein